MFVTRLFWASGKAFGCLLLAAVFLSLPTQAMAASLSEDNLDGLLAQLAGTDPTERIGAATALNQHGQAALPMLMRAYDHGDASHRKGCILGILLMPYPALGMDVLERALGDADQSIRSIAAQGMALIGRPAAPRLVALLGSDNPDVRNAAGFSLKLMKKQAVPALAKGLTNHNEFVRGKSAWLLGDMGTDALPATSELVNALDTADPRVMHVVAEAIDLIDPDPAVVTHQLTLLNADTTGCPVRRVGGDAAPLLVRLLSRPGTPLAQTAYRTLAHIGPPALPALTAGANDGPLGKRVACALLALAVDPDTASELPQDVLAAIRHAQQPQQ